MVEMGFLPNLTTTTLLAACVICNFGKCSVYGYLISLSRTITISQEKVRCWCYYSLYPEWDGVILVRLPGIGSPPAADKLNQYLNDQALTAYNTFFGGILAQNWWWPGQWPCWRCCLQLFCPVSSLGFGPQSYYPLMFVSLRPIFHFSVATLLLLVRAVENNWMYILLVHSSVF